MEHLKITQEVGARCGFTGGAEPTPIVEVITYFCPGSMNDGDTTLAITNEHGNVIVLSPGTMKSIIAWACKE